MERRPTSRSAADLTPAAPTPLKPVSQHEAPLVADHLGNTFLAWAPGYPSATGISVVPFRERVAGGRRRDVPRPLQRRRPPHGAERRPPGPALGRLDAGRHPARGAIPQPRDGLRRDRLRPAARHRLPDLRTGPRRAASARSTSSSTPARASSSRRSSRGSRFASSRSRRRSHKKTVVTWWAQALDDGFGVPGATFSGAGHTAHGNASGTANLSGAGFKRGSAKAAAPGYVGASFRVP